MEAGRSSESVVTSYETRSCNPEKNMNLYSHGKNHTSLPTNEIGYGLYREKVKV